MLIMLSILSILRKIIFGGQISAHRVRMFRQIFKVTFMLSLVSGGAFFCTKILSEPFQDFSAVYHLIRCNFSQKEYITFGEEAWKSLLSRRKETLYEGCKTIKWKQPKGKLRAVEKKRAMRLLTQKTNTLKRKAFRHLRHAIFVFIGVFSLVFFIFYLFGSELKKKKLLSGKEVKKRWLPNLRTKGGLRIGKAVLSKHAETQHMLITGGTGSGKTNAIHHLLSQIRKRKQRAIIIDTSSHFIGSYYDPKKDFILNPFDARAEEWHPWADCKECYDFSEIASAFIHMTGREKDPFWKNSARSVFESLLWRGKKDKDLPYLCKMLMREPLALLAEYLRGTEAGTLIDRVDRNTGHSVRVSTSVELKVLRYFKKTASPFSIRDWVHSEDENSFLFLSCLVDQRNTLVQLLSTWFTIALRSALSLKADLNRRIWFINDELPSMKRINSLETCLTEGRKVGICALLAVQSPAQIDTIYEEAKTIKGQLSTTLIFRETNAEVAEQVSKRLGRKEVQESQEGISYGAHEMRDGVNQSNVNRERPVISATEIQNLQNHECFLQKPDKSPIEKLKLNYINPPQKAKIFIKAKGLDQQYEEEPEETATSSEITALTEEILSNEENPAINEVSQ